MLAPPTFQAWPVLQEEKSRLEEAIARLASEEGVVGEEEGERVAAIRQAYQADKEKLGKIKTLLVSVHRLGVGRNSYRVWYV